MLDELNPQMIIDYMKKVAKGQGKAYVFKASNSRIIWCSYYDNKYAWKKEYSSGSCNSIQEKEAIKLIETTLNEMKNVFENIPLLKETILNSKFDNPLESCNNLKTLSNN